MFSCLRHYLILQLDRQAIQTLRTESGDSKVGHVCHAPRVVSCACACACALCYSCHVPLGVSCLSNVCFGCAVPITPACLRPRFSLCLLQLASPFFTISKQSLRLPCPLLSLKSISQTFFLFFVCVCIAVPALATPAAADQS